MPVSYTHLDVYKRQVFASRITFPIHDSLGNPIGFTARSMDCLLYTSIAAGITLAALALTLHEVRRQKKQTPAASALNILGRSCGMTGLIAVLEIPVLIILVNKLQGAAWNYYTNFLYTDCLLYTSRCV